MIKIHRKLNKLIFRKKYYFLKKHFHAGIKLGWD